MPTLICPKCNFPCEVTTEELTGEKYIPCPFGGTFENINYVEKDKPKRELTKKEIDLLYNDGKPLIKSQDKIEESSEPESIEDLGRLHEVNSTRKVATCRMCNKEIPKGSKCYDQSIKAIPFRIKTKVHYKPCGQDLIKKGCKVALKKKK